MNDKEGIYNISQSEIIIYQTEDGNTQIDVKFEDETVWLTQAQLCELFQTSKSNVSEHIKHIFEEGELEEKSVVRKFRTTAADGKSKTGVQKISCIKPVASRRTLLESIKELYTNAKSAKKCN